MTTLLVVEFCGKKAKIYQEINNFHMEFNIAKNKIADNVDVAIMRGARYHKLPLDSTRGRQLSFVRPLSLAGYPRFHIYLKETKTDYIFALHLDQKKPTYSGAKAHQGDYDSQIIEQEVQRIKQKLLKSNFNS